MHTARSLVFTTITGWWSYQSWLWVAWRSLYVNWRSAFTWPHDSLAHGAISIDDLFDSADFDDEEEDLEEVFGVGSPMSRLSRADARRVLNAEDLYEKIGVSHDASQSEIRTAFRARSKEFHPDLNPEAGSAGGRKMAEINEARAILEKEELRAAYDWLQEQVVS